MSGIFGVVRFRTDVPDRDAVGAMAGDMSRWGDGGPSLATLRGAAFGHALRLETPEDEHSTMPHLLESAGLLATAEGRLDNRVDVLSALGLTSEVASSMADSTVMVRAYLAWGHDAWARLFGDWSFAAWHPAEQRLVLARDHHGSTSLYYHRDRDRALFASDPRALVAAGVPRRLNEVRLAQGLVSWSGTDPAETIDLGILRVPPAHAVELTPEVVRSRQYWHAPAVPQPTRRSVEEYAEGLLAVLDEATRARCRSVGSIATTLSGGLDSGSVTVLAERHLQEQGSSLTSYTSVPITDTSMSVGRARFGDESALSAATARKAGIDSHVLLDSASISPMEGIERALAALDQPTHAASNAYWIHDVLATANATGHRTLLTGQGGNATISWTGRSSGSRLAARWRDRGLLGALGYLVPAPVHRRRVAHVLRQNDWARTAVNPGFARRIDLAGRMAASIGQGNLPLPRATPLQLRAAITQPGATRIGDLWSMNSAYSGVDVRDPTSDARVIDYSFAVPDTFFRGPDGTDRWLLRTAMAGLLPDEVRLNRDRGRQSADLTERLRRSAAEVEAAFAEIAGGPAEEFVSVPRMRAAWTAAQQSSEPMVTHQAGSILLRGMMAALWITRTHG